VKKLLLLTFLVLIQPCLSFSKDYEFYEADIGRCMVLKFNDNTGAVSLQQYKYDTCSSRQTYLIPMVRTAARYEVLIKETDGDFIDYVFLSEEVLINSNADGAIVEHRLKDPEIQELSRAIEAGKSFNIAYFNGVYWTGPRFDLPKRIEPILAIECSTDPKECTPKKLCEFATDQDGSNQDGSNTVWSDASNKVKHVRFAQSLGMTCGVITITDLCDTDPNECKISQLCDKATTYSNGQTSWDDAAQDYVDVAKEYGMSCDVKAQKARVKRSCSAATPKKCTDNQLCLKAAILQNSKYTWVENGSSNSPLAYEARARQLVCTEALSYDDAWAAVDEKRASNDFLCDYLEKTSFDIDTKWYLEAKNRSLDCLVEVKAPASNTTGVENEGNNIPSDADNIVPGKAISPVVAYDFDKGLAAAQAGDYATALQELRPLAEQGNADAQFFIGMMYANGDGAPQEYAEAMKWWQLAAERGLANAQHKLGYMYGNGLGVPQDNIESMKWHTLAAEQGDVNSQYNLGMMYANGDGATQDYAEAIKWWRLAAKQGLADAQHDLGTMYLHGEGVSRDLVEAIKWFRLAAELGFLNSQYNLGMMYANGDGVLQDNTLSHMWFTIAFANGDEDAGEQRYKREGLMTTSDVSKARSLAIECMNSNYTKCGY
jgi:TPR repeat protein